MEQEQRRFGKRRQVTLAKVEPAPQVVNVQRSDFHAVRAHGIVSFLRCLVGRPRLMTDILHEAGFSSQTKQTLRENRVNFQTQVCKQWAALLRGLLNWQEAELVIRCFRFDDLPKLCEKSSQNIFRLPLGEAVIKAHEITIQLRNKRSQFEAVVIWEALAADGIWRCA